MVWAGHGEEQINALRVWAPDYVSKDKHKVLKMGRGEGNSVLNSRYPWTPCYVLQIETVVE